jgi:hypothetical protein
VTLVKEAVAEWKRQRREVFVPLTYRPGDLAEVDFFEVLVDLLCSAPTSLDDGRLSTASACSTS